MSRVCRRRYKYEDCKRDIKRYKKYI